MSRDGRATTLRRRRVRMFSGLCSLLFGLLVCGPGSAAASSGTFPYEDAVTYCRGDVTRPIALSDDGSILCFDGDIINDQDLSSVGSLKENGLFVIRSPGGSVPTAIALAELVRDRHAIVVVYDYCVSACAAYLLIAADRTIVRKNSLVAWHHTYTTSDGLPDCYELRSAADGGPKILQTVLCDDVAAETKARYAHFEALSLRFFQKRTLDPSRFGRGFDFPQSVHVRRALKNMLDARGMFPAAVWMWNPRYYGTLFKTTVTYQAYPESQDEVDELAARFGFRNAIYDP